MISWLFLSLPLIVPPDNADASAVSNCVSEIPRPYESVEPSTVADGVTSDGISTPSATVKLLCGVRDSLNSFGPLRSLAGDLCLILENCKVWPPSYIFNLQHLQSFQETGVDEQAIESLAPRIKTLSELLHTPIPLGDVNEKERERKLDR